MALVSIEQDYTYEILIYFKIGLCFSFLLHTALAVLCMGAVFWGHVVEIYTPVR